MGERLHVHSSEMVRCFEAVVMNAEEEKDDLLDVGIKDQMLESKKCQLLEVWSILSQMQ